MTKGEREIRRAGLTFWLEGKILFGKIISTGLVFCCGSKPMPETKEEAFEYMKTAWIW